MCCMTSSGYYCCIVDNSDTLSDQKGLFIWAQMKLWQQLPFILQISTIESHPLFLENWCCCALVEEVGWLNKFRMTNSRHCTEFIEPRSVVEKILRSKCRSQHFGSLLCDCFKFLDQLLKLFYPLIATRCTLYRNIIQIYLNSVSVFRKSWPENLASIQM